MESEAVVFGEFDYGRIDDRCVFRYIPRESAQPRLLPTRTSKAQQKKKKKTQEGKKQKSQQHALKNADPDISAFIFW